MYIVKYRHHGYGNMHALLCLAHALRHLPSWRGLEVQHRGATQKCNAEVLNRVFFLSFFLSFLGGKYPT